MGRGLPASTFNLIQRALDLVHDPPDIVIDRLIAKANHSESASGQPSAAPAVVLDCSSLKMLRPVQLYNQAVRETDEIDNVGTYGSLAPELRAQLPSLQEMPETFFGQCWFIVKPAGELALFVVSVHRAVFNPLPSPPRKGEVAKPVRGATAYFRQ